MAMTTIAQNVKFFNFLCCDWVLEEDWQMKSMMWRKEICRAFQQCEYVYMCLVYIITNVNMKSVYGTYFQVFVIKIF